MPRRSVRRGERHQQRTVTRNGWPSSHALHGAESHTRARSAAPSATAATTYQAHVRGARCGAARISDPRGRQQHTAGDEPGLMGVADPDPARQVLEHPRRRADGVGSPGAGITGTGKRAHRADSCAACTVTSSASTHQQRSR